MDLTPGAIPRTILLVDDDPHIRFLLASSLERHGYRVLVAKSGLHALEVSRRYEGPIDVLLLDVLMPGMSGVELAAQFLPMRPDTRILLMSDSDLALGALADHGGLEYIPKPFSTDTLLTRVHGLLRVRS